MGHRQKLKGNGLVCLEQVVQVGARMLTAGKAAALFIYCLVVCRIFALGNVQ